MIEVKRHKRRTSRGYTLVKKHTRRLDKKKRKHKNLIVGGLADKVPYSKFNKSQLKKGIKVELEHTKNPLIAKEIASDHLMEDPRYYDHLEEMEKKYSKPHKSYSAFPALNAPNRAELLVNEIKLEKDPDRKVFLQLEYEKEMARRAASR